MNNDNHNEVPSAELLEELDWQAIKVTIFRAALELQIWNKVDFGLKTAQGIAEENGWDITGTQRLLDALCGMKLLDKIADEYQLVPIAKSYLLSGTPGFMGDGFLADMGWEGNGKLADAIRTGTRPIISDWTSSTIAAFWASYEAPSRLRPEKVVESKDNIWHLLDIRATEGLRVLDVACGSASLTLALGKQNPSVSLTLNDWPPVVESVLGIAEKLGIRQQITPLPGDVHSVDFGENQYDLIWIGDFLHFWGPNEIVRILKRLYQALAPGGVLVIKESVVDEARRESFWLLGSLWLFGVSQEGNLYAPSEWLGLIKKAGFPDPIPVNKENELPYWFKASKH